MKPISSFEGKLKSIENIMGIILKIPFIAHLTAWMRPYGRDVALQPIKYLEKSSELFQFLASGFVSTINTLGCFAEKLIDVSCMSTNAWSRHQI